MKHIRKIGLILAWFSFLLFSVHAQTALAGGKIIVNNDEWTLSDTGFSRLPNDTRRFVTNLAKFFAGEKNAFHAFSTNFGFTGSSLRATLTGNGYAYSTGFGIPFDLPTLSGFDGIFLGGNLLNDEQINTLISYVNSGGNVYLAAGTSQSNPGAVANTWNKFLGAFGLSIASNNNGVTGNIVVANSPHPIFAGVRFLYQVNGQNIFDLDPADPTQEIIVFSGSRGLYAARGLAISTRALSAIKLGDFSTQQLEAILGEPPFTWSLVAGTLPPGMNLSPEGVLSGIPSEAADFTFTVKVIDSNGDFAEKEFTLKVLVTLPPPDIRIFKTGTTPVPGRVLDYFIVVENAGIVVVEDQGITEYIEPWFSFLDSSVPPTTISSLVDPFSAEPGSTDYTAIVKWRIPILNPGEVRILAYRVEFDSTFPLGEIVTGQACIDPWGDDVCDESIPDLLPICAAECAITLPFGPQICIACVGGIGAFWAICRGTCALADALSRGAVDPNEKLVSTNKYIQPDQLLVYPIHFENIGDAEALDVFVTDVLDPNLDESTLEILTPDRASFDEITRTLRWELFGRNLQPGETDNVLLSIRPKPGLASGTEIRNSAEIQFEIFEPLVTPEVVNIIDTTLPNCMMDQLPAESSTPFLLSWTGTDEIGEIDTYSVFVSTDGGPFTPFLERTSDTSTSFEGEIDKTYGFICIATDTAGNTEVQDPTAETETQVISAENDPPEAVCNDVTIATDPGACAALPDPGVLAAQVGAGSTDPNGDPITLSVSPPGPYSLGDNAVTLTVMDDKGASDSCDAMVTVVDQEPPALSCPASLLEECSGPDGAAIIFSSTATDNCTESPSVSCDPPSGSLFSFGSSSVTCTATDESGNSSSCDFTVTVQDTTPPTIDSLTADPDMLWPPNHKMVPVTVMANATDICDSEPGCQIISVTSNEPENGLGDGNTAPDWEITGDLTLNLRAERAGNGSGREYTITVQCTDAAGNTDTADTTVIVPHNR